MFRAQRHHRLESYLKRLYGYAYSLTHDADRSEDLVHDTVVKALAARRIPHDEPAYRTWLRRPWADRCALPTPPASPAYLPS